MKNLCLVKIFEITDKKAQWAPAPHNTQYVTVPDTDVLMKTNPPVETVDSSRHGFQKKCKIFQKKVLIKSKFVIESEGVFRIRLSNKNQISVF